MKAIWFTSVVFLTLEIVRSPAPATRNLESAGSYLNSQSTSGSKYSPSDIMKITSGKEDVNSACRNECLTLQSEISEAFEKNKTSKPIKFLYDICGNANGGHEAAYGLVCMCEIPKQLDGQRRIAVQLCRLAIQLIRTFSNSGTKAAGTGLTRSYSRKLTNRWGTSKDAGLEETIRSGSPSNRGRKMRVINKIQATAAGDSSARIISKKPKIRREMRDAPFEEVHMHNYPRNNPGPSSSYSRSRNLSPNANPFVPAVPVFVPPPRRAIPAAEDWNTKPDNEPEGSIFVTDVAIEGQIVRAIVDTGAAISMIHPDYADETEPFDEPCVVRLFNNQEHHIEGRTTIYVEVRRGINVPMTGFVTSHSPGLIIGVDFFFAHLAKIWLPQQIMEISVGGRKVTMHVKPRDFRVETSMMISGLKTYKPLEISIHLNESPTKMVIDTGSSVTMVNRDSVGGQRLRRSDQMVAIGTVATTLLGEADVNIRIGNNELTYRALVPQFTPEYSFLAGNDFNRWYVELIDFESKAVFMRFLDLSGFHRTSTQAFIFADQEDDG